MTEWDEFPIWVPFEGGVLAAVVTVPRQPPRALVAFLQGAGASRSHRNGLWTRTARGLAEHGLASVRFDYPPLGDSTGDARLEWESPPIGEAMAVVEAAAEIVGVGEVATVGNCLGARIGFALAPQLSSCHALVSIVVGGGGAFMKEPSSSAAGTAVRSAFRRAPRLKKLLRRVVKRRPRVHDLDPEVAAVLRSRLCLFVLVGGERWAERFGDALKQASHGAATSGGGPEILHVLSERVGGFRLPLDQQSVVIDAMVAWLDRTLPVATELSSRPQEDPSVQEVH